MKFTEEQLQHFFDEDLPEDTGTDHDYKYTWCSYVVPFEGKHYEFRLRWDRDNGLDMWGGCDAYEVEQKEITTIETVWTPIK